VNVAFQWQDDPYYFSGLDSGWFATNFEPSFSRFPFIGAREKLAQMQKEKSLARSVIEAVSRRVKITSLLSLVTEHVVGIKLPKGSEPNKLAEELIKKLDEERNKQTLEKFLSHTQANCRKKKRYFDTVSIYTTNGSAFSKATQSALQNEIIVVSGQLVHRSAIAQYNDHMAQTVANLPGEWLLADFPPNGMVPDNTRFDGRVIGLAIEKEFAELFKNYLPFRTDFGWYPYARITGFFKEPDYGQSAPTLSVIMTEFRRPKPYAERGRTIFDFLDEELKNRIYLGDKSNLLVASYMLPLVASGSNIGKFTAAPAEKQIVQRYLEAAGDGLPLGLKGWYGTVG
jgi:hypothetical protein